MRYTTLRFRIKDQTAGKYLAKMARSVNFVWNYCNEVNYDRWQKFNKGFTAFELSKLTAGCARDLQLNAQTVQAISEEYAKRCIQFKRNRLNWRSKKRSLGWIPFKGQDLKIKGDTIYYLKRPYRFWLSKPIEGIVRSGSFSQDAKGCWYLNLVIEEGDKGRIKTGNEVGIDLGLKTLATLSNGTELSRENLTRKFERELAMAQRARKKRRVTAIHAKIRNKRKDWNHKTTTRLVRQYDRIVVGNVSSKKFMKTRLAKSVSDASWSAFKTMLVYKAIALGVEVNEVNESFSTVTCSSCKERTGPKGVRGLKVREWVCSGCGSVHQRDVNAAKNILSFSVRGI